MVFGHLPFGYITSELLFNRFKKRHISINTFRFWTMSGAIAPDIDMLFYYVHDDIKFHSPHMHHSYFTHFPFFWVKLLGISIVWLLLDNNRGKLSPLAFMFTLGGFTHLILDTMTGYVYWLAPFHNKLFSFETNNPWETNYFTHWGFGVEVCLILSAVYLWYKRLNKASLVNPLLTRCQAGNLQSKTTAALPDNPS